MKGFIKIKGADIKCACGEDKFHFTGIGGNYLINSRGVKDCILWWLQRDELPEEVMLHTQTDSRHTVKIHRMLYLLHRLYDTYFLAWLAQRLEEKGAIPQQASRHPQEGA